MSSTATLLKPNGAHAEETQRSWLTPLRLHWLGVALLLGVITFLLVRLGLLWHDAATHSPDAIAQQRIALKTADAAAEPLRGVDAKVAQSTAEADRFYRDRLPLVQSQVVAELGDLAKRNNVRMTRVSYTPAAVLVGTSNELTEWKIDASLSGDYRPLVQFINALERDKMFFVINGVTLTGQQTGTVNLRLRLTTYLRGAAGAAAVSSNGVVAEQVPAGGAQ
jgi:hypothetical protein